VTRAESGPLLAPGFWLQQAALSWRAELDTRLRPLGLTPTQFNVLASVLTVTTAEAGVKKGLATGSKS